MKVKFLLAILFITLPTVSAGLFLSARKNNTSYKANNLRPADNNSRPVPPQFTDKSLFLTPIKLSKIQATTERVTGITVPHHLLAADLIADAFKYSSKNSYDQILLFSPDHYFLGDSNISISEQDFSTVFGLITTDRQAVAKIEGLPFVKKQNFFYREHGLGAELPFIKYYFPNAKIIALTFKESTPKIQIDQTIDTLKKVINPKTLVVQSTDFSHYLAPANAEIHDKQTIAVLKNNNPEDLFNLNQPDNLDSIASQYVQSRLQKEFFRTSLLILAHKNSQSYTTQKITSTTSYITQAYQSQQK